MFFGCFFGRFGGLGGNQERGQLETNAVSNGRRSWTNSFGVVARC